VKTHRNSLGRKWVIKRLHDLSINDISFIDKKQANPPAGARQTIPE
jgi:hypothetical protein